MIIIISYCTVVSWPSETVPTVRTLLYIDHSVPCLDLAAARLPARGGKDRERNRDREGESKSGSKRDRGEERNIGRENERYTERRTFGCPPNRLPTVLLLSVDRQHHYNSTSSPPATTTTLTTIISITIPLVFLPIVFFSSSALPSVLAIYF